MKLRFGVLSLMVVGALAISPAAGVADSPGFGFKHAKGVQKKKLKRAAKPKVKNQYAWFVSRSKRWAIVCGNTTSSRLEGEAFRRVRRKWRFDRTVSSGSMQMIDSICRSHKRKRMDASPVSLNVGDGYSLRATYRKCRPPRGFFPGGAVGNLRAKRTSCKVARRVSSVVYSDRPTYLGFRCRVVGSYGDGGIWRCVNGAKVIRFKKGG